MICNTIGLTADSFESIYTTGGTEVEEVYGAINYAQPIYAKIREMTGTSPLTFTSRTAGTLTDYRISGETLQDGTPSPDYPVDVVGVGERTENLFDKDASIDGYYNADGSYNSGSTNWFTSDYIKVRQDQAYTLKFEDDEGIVYVVFFDNNMAFISRSGAYVLNGIQTFRPSANGYVRFCLNKNVVPRIDLVMLTESSTPPDHYIPYGYKIPITCGGVTQNIYLDEPLRKIGDYADEIDFKTGTVTRRIVETVFTGRETLYLQYAASNIIRVYAPIVSCLNYIQLSSHGSIIVTGTMVTFFNPPYAKYFRFTVPDLKAYLAEQYAAGSPVKLYSVRLTPTTESITLPTITPTPGSNMISIDTALQPSQVSITGHIKPSGSYGNLTDVNGVNILDKAGVQIKVHGQ